MKIQTSWKALLDLFLQEYLPADIQAQFSTSRELIRNIHNSFQRLRDRAEKMAERSQENATDLLLFGQELRYSVINGKSRGFLNKMQILCSWEAGIQYEILLTMMMMLSSAALWARRLPPFPPWPPHKALGGLCVSLLRACLWSLLCCLTKLLSRYISQSCFCCCFLYFNRSPKLRMCIEFDFVSSGQERGGWCCRKTELLLRFAAVLQGE